MFESKGKHNLKTKYSKMTPNVMNSNSVYGELKLSDQLSSQIKELKDEIWHQKEKMEEDDYEK